MKTLKVRLREGVAPCYYVAGEDYYLYEKALAMIAKAMNLSLPDFNKNVFDDDNYSMQAVLNTCEFMPMGSDYRLVVIKNVVKVSDKEQELLENYIKNPCKTSVLVILDFYNKLPYAKNICEYVDARRMDRALARGIVVNELAKRGKQISGEAVDTLLEYGNGYLTNVMNELDKLVYFDMNDSLITKKVVENVSNKNSEFTVFELSEALGKRNADKALKLLSEMEKDPGTLSLITNHFRRLFFISISDNDNASLASLLGVKEYAIMKQREQTKNFSKMQLKKIYTLLEKLDFQIKSGEMLTSSALYDLVFSILFI